MNPQTRPIHSHHLSRLLHAAWLGLCLLPSAGHAQQLDWSAQLGTANDDRGNAVAVYADGVYIVGQLDAETPGGDGRNAVGEGYVHRYDTAGNVVWQRRFGTSPLDAAYAVAVDATGVYVTGATTAAPANRLNPDVLLTRYDHNGNQMWSRQFGDASGDTGYGVALDATGVYVAGGANWLHRGFVAKYTRDGADRWTRYFGDVTTDTEDWATGVATDASGVYVSGILNSYSGSPDAVLLRYDSDGSLRWTRVYSTPDTERGHAVAVNADGIYLAGYWRNALEKQGYIRSYNRAGALQWQGSFDGGVNAITADKGGVYAVGEGDYFADTSFATVYSYASSGQIRWDIRLGGFRAFNPANGAAISPEGLFVAGSTSDAFEGGTARGGFDAFLLKVFTGAQPVAGAGYHVLCPGDVDGDGMPDIAAVSNFNDGLVLGLDGRFVTYFLIDFFEGIADVELVADTDGNGAPELAALRAAEVVERDTGILNVLTAVHDLRTGSQVSSYRKGDGISFPTDLEVLGDIDGNGYPELAALGSEGNKVKLKDAIEQQWLNTVPFTNRYVPADLEIYPDLDGDGLPELAVLGEHKSADKADKLEIRNLLTGLLVRERYLSKQWSVLKQELLRDTDGNGFPEVAILRTRPVSDTQAQNQFIIFDTSPGMPQVRLRGVEQFFTPLQILNIGDINGNGTDDLAVFGRQLNNPSQKAQVFDSGRSTARLSTVFFDRNFVGQDFNTCPDLNGNGTPELVLLGKRADNGRVRAIVKDSRSGALLGTVDFDFGTYR